MDFGLLGAPCRGLGCLVVLVRVASRAMDITLVRGDITEQQVDAIVTAANIDLSDAGDVNAAVHAAAGPRLLEACQRLAPCPAGSAVVTPAFELAPVQWVIHAVGPIYSGPLDAATLASAYVSAMARADEVGARSVAFPSISTGAYGYPAHEAARISIEALSTVRTSVEQVLLVAYSRGMEARWGEALVGP